MSHVDKGDAIIAVAFGGTASLVAMVTDENWKIEAQCDFDSIAEHTFNVLPGLYYASCKGSYCCGESCNGYPCEGDCFEVDWVIGEPLYVIPWTVEEVEE